MKYLKMIAAAVLLSVPTYYAMAAWLRYYDQFVDVRYQQMFEAGAWRSEGSQYSNAQIGVMFEVFGPPLLILVAYVVVLAVMYRYLGKQTSQG